MNYYKIITKLIGPIQPTETETLDPIRKENLLLTINLVDKLLNDICLTATSKDQDEPSAKEIRFIAYNYLSQLNNEIKKYNKEALISTSSIKLIGYKIKDNYIEYFKNMVTTSIPVHSFSKQPVTFTVGGQWYEFTKKAGVLDVWFEPVYGVTPKKQEIYYQVKEEYVQYFKNLMKSNMSVTDILTREIEIDSPWYNICVKAEVLDLWCNKMYKLDYLF